MFEAKRLEYRLTKKELAVNLEFLVGRPVDPGNLWKAIESATNPRWTVQPRVRTALELWEHFGFALFPAAKRMRDEREEEAAILAAPAPKLKAKPVTKAKRRARNGGVAELRGLIGQLVELIKVAS
jgi:hypothetical protein